MSHPEQADETDRERDDEGVRREQAAERAGGAESPENASGSASENGAAGQTGDDGEDGGKSDAVEVEDGESGEDGEVPKSGTQFVAVDDVAEQIERRVGDTGYKSKMANIIEELPEKYVERERREDGYVIKLNVDGLSEVRQQNTGTAGSGGGHTHRYVLRQAYETLTAAGFIVELPEQEGENQPDGIGELPVDLSSDNYPEMRAKMGELKENWPDAHRLSNGQNIYIEAETSTTSKPQQTLSNLQKAHSDGRRCVFIFQDTYDEDAGQDMVKRARDAVRILTDPPGVAHRDRQSRRFYNQSDRLEIKEDTYAIRTRTGDGSSGVYTYWWERDDGTVVLTDSDNRGGTPLVQFDGLRDILNPDPSDVPAYYTYDRTEKEYIVTDNQGEGTANRTIYTDKEQFKEDWAKIYPPFIPEAEFDGRLPTPEDWVCIVFPNDDTGIPPLEYVYNGHNSDGSIDAELRPVLAKDRADFDPSTLEPYIDRPEEIPGDAGEREEEDEEADEAGDGENGAADDGGGDSTDEPDGEDSRDRDRDGEGEGDDEGEGQVEDDGRAEHEGDGDEDERGEAEQPSERDAVSGAATDSGDEHERERQQGVADADAATDAATDADTDGRAEAGAVEPSDDGGSGVEAEISTDPEFDFNRDQFDAAIDEGNGDGEADDGTGGVESERDEGAKIETGEEGAGDGSAKSEAPRKTEANGESEITGPGETSSREAEADGEDGVDRDGDDEDGSKIKSGGWYLVEGLVDDHLLAPENEDLNDSLPENQDQRQDLTLCRDQFRAVPQEVDNPFDHTDTICGDCERNLHRRAAGENEIAKRLQQYDGSSDSSLIGPTGVSGSPSGGNR